MVHLFQRHELRRARRTDAGPAVDDGLSRQREFADVVPDHLGLDLDALELLPIVDGDLLANEVGKDWDIAAVSAEGRVRPLAGTETLHEDRLQLIEATDVRAACPRGQELDNLLQSHRAQLVERVAAVCELALSPDLHARRALPQLPPCRLRKPNHLLRHVRLPPPRPEPLRLRRHPPDLSSWRRPPGHRRRTPNVLVRAPAMRGI